MHSFNNDNHFPKIDGAAELSAAAGRIVQVIQEFEECWRRGTLKLPLAAAENEALVGRVLMEPYEAITFEAEESLWPYREQWIGNALDEFTGACAPPPVVFRAVDSDEPDKFQILTNKEKVVVRTDQAFSVRFWGVGIEPENSQSSVRLTNHILHRAATNLARDISSINKLCRMHASKRILRPDRIRWTTNSRGVAFERLIADTLNEDSRRATRASLWEDLLEWTDLRVRYAGLVRKDGARIQVKLIGNEAVEDQEVARKKHREFYVVVSPVQLARYVEECLESGSAELVGNEFWNCFPGQPGDAAELALALEEMFLRTMANRTAHPLGPMARLPSVIRRLIQTYVQAAAFSTTEQVRNEVAQHPTRAPGWRWRA